MRRRLIVMRHAKSSWADAGSDHERPLNGRGRDDAPRVAARLAALGWAPERVLSSSAERTRATWALMEPAFEPAPAVSFERALYLAGPREVEEALTRLPADVASVLLLGHNDGWERVVAWLTGEDVRLTTANAALLSAEGETWAEAIARAPGWRLHEVVRPKEL